MEQTRKLISKGWKEDMKACGTRIGCVTLFGLAVAVFDPSTLAWGNEFVVPPASQDSRSTFLNFVSCYDIRTWAKLDCGVTYKILGLEPPAQVPCDPAVETCVTALANTGGHNHNGSHPLIDNRQDAGVQLLKDGIVFAGTLDREISFQTDNNVVVVLHNVPQVAGRIAIETFVVQFPPGYVCAGVCDFRDTVNVQVPHPNDFPELETGGSHHVVVRDGTGSHPQGTNGTEDTIRKLRQVAQAYFDSTGRKLSINDLSLPKGGMFDLNAGWFVNNVRGNGHIDHRTGIDADINREDGGGVFTNCEDDQKLHKAVEKVNETLSSNGKIRFECKESGGRKHVDFD